MDSWSMPTHSHRSPSRSTSVPYRQPSVLTGMNNDIISAVSAGTNRDTWKNALHLLKAVRGDVPTVNVSERIFPGSSGGLGKVPSSPGISPILMSPDARTCIFGHHRILAGRCPVEGLE